MKLKNREINLRTTAYCLRAKGGFTLIEILIVVSIIGLLASIIFVGLGSSRAKARDGRRITDLRSMQLGLEQFNLKYGQYPVTLPEIVSGGLGITKIPKDPSTGNNYLYATKINADNNSKRDGYVLGAKLEIPTIDLGASSAEFSGSTYSGDNFVTTCGTTYYCVSF